MLCLSLKSVARDRSSPSGIASITVQSCSVTELNMIDALLHLGQEYRVPLAIEYLDAAAFRKQVSFCVQNSTFGALLNTITHAQGYSWFVCDGVVIVTHKEVPQGAKNLLNTRIAEFRLPREETLHAASLQLLSTLRFALHSDRNGIVGDYPTGNAQVRVGPWTMRNATVRRILNRIVSQHRNGAWVVQQAPWNMDKDPPYGLWRVFEYEGSAVHRLSTLLQGRVFRQSERIGGAFR